ncbi:DUF6503 family protein [Robiginitalea aurantiaca]|uniref:DUF6503 family protein n=1 Tax=Robiginitalea aurantiaca TaxID=3056915 RepID=A0ABT7WAU9_9FLAO|nr:DUF6503 family protein [Robiginitalea aurantiaca]MDM9630050.1 DUF6503 family protein [Robiginitalea aurantiaca]
MRNLLILSCFLFCFFIGKSQDLTAEDLLTKSIAYHDPDGVWGSMNGVFTVRMDTPDRPARISEITINQESGLFRLYVEQNGATKTYEVSGSKCTLLLNGKETFSDAEAEEQGLNCERARMYRDYYSYLYGLPMKLRDKGTKLDPAVQKKTFKGKAYLVLKVTYDEAVGKDIWYFYFDPVTYAMEVYQFFHDESKNDGEYILLKEIQNVSGIKMPKVRAWYYNKDDKYLGTDTLMNSEKTE